MNATQTITHFGTEPFRSVWPQFSQEMAADDGGRQKYASNASDTNGTLMCARLLCAYMDV